MLKIHEIREIIKLVDESSISEFEVEGEDGTRIAIRKQGGPVQAAQPVNETKPPVETVAKPTPETVTSPQVTQQPVIEKTKAEAPQDIDPGLHKIESPMVGTFYKAPEPGAEPFVKPGDKVDENTVVCIVEAMKLFNEIEAELRGEIVEVLVEDGQLVEYGQPLFLVKPE